MPSSVAQQSMLKRRVQLCITHPLYKTDNEVPNEQNWQGRNPEHKNRDPRKQSQQENRCHDYHINGLQLRRFFAAQMHTGELERRVLRFQKVKSARLVLHRGADAGLGQIEAKRSRPPTTD